MTSLVALSLAELRLLIRNRTAAGMAILLPLAFGGLWILGDPEVELSVSAIAALQVLVLLGFTVYVTATTTLVARRQSFVLKRWRTSAAATSTILAGTVAPYLVLLAIQATILLGAMVVATGEPPASVALLVVTIALGAVLGAAAAFATAAFTRTAESAMMTTTPAFVALIGGGMWALTTAPAEVSDIMLATGGGALAQLLRMAWSEPVELAALSAYLLELAPSLIAIAALTIAAMVIAVLAFRWEPRG